MRQFITPYLIQHRTCSLAGLGRFQLTELPASLDVAAKEILPPQVMVSFTPQSDHTDGGLIDYVAAKQSLNREEAATKLDNWCRDAAAALQQGETIHLPMLGNLKQSADDKVSFIPEEIETILQPVAAVRIIRKDAAHPVLVGDSETTTTAMNEYLQAEEPVAKDRWALMAVILLIVGLCVLGYHFYTGGGMTHRGTLPAPPPPDTYLSK